jgi:O-antigen ligase
MIAHYKALVVVLILGSFAALLSRRVLSPSFIAAEDFRFRTTISAILLVLAFLVPNVWLLAALVALVLMVAARKEANAMALYALLLLILPPFYSVIPLPGGGTLFLLSNSRLVTLALAAPVAWSIYRQHRSARTGIPKLVDWLVGLFILYRLVMMLPHYSSVTSILRDVFHSVIDVWIPYYVASRAIQDRHQLKDIIGTMLACGAFVGLLAIFETARRWQLFNLIEAHMHLPTSSRGYMSRGYGGPLRAVATGGHPIVLGVFLMLLVPLYLSIYGGMKKGFQRVALLLMICGGLVASFSRGPWLATIFAGLVYLLVATRLSKAIFQFALIGGAVSVVLLVTPLGDLILPYLPFLGAGTQSAMEDYRVQLFHVSMEVIQEHPVFGDPLYLKNPKMEVMRQGEGIIDMVNSYLDIALSYGLVGLAIFIAPVLAAWIHVTRNLSSLPPESLRMNAALCACVAGVMFSIVSVSQIYTIPYWIWILTGVCVGSWTAQSVPEPSAAGSLVAPRSPGKKRW